ncbi:NPP1 family protein [Streptomyces sp. 900105755]
MSSRRVQVVYHEDGLSTHDFRVARWGETPEDDDAAWHRENLLTWDTMASSLRAVLNASDWGDANFPLQDAWFDDHLGKAEPSAITFDAYA